MACLFSSKAFAGIVSPTYRGLGRLVTYWVAHPQLVVLVVALVERWTRDRKVAGSTPGWGAIKVNSAFHPSGLVNRVPACMAGVKVGCVNLWQAAGNTVWSHMAHNTL